MKRRDLINHLLRSGCFLLREGSRHSVFGNLETRQTSSVPRHNEIDNFLAKKICDDLGIKNLKKR